MFAIYLFVAQLLTEVFSPNLRQKVEAWFPQLFAKMNVIIVIILEIYEHC